MKEDRPRKRGEIQLGDLARALERLAPRDETQAVAIAAHLGFGLRPGQHPAEQRELQRERFDRASELAPPAASKPSGPPPVYTPPTPTPPLELPRATLPSRLVTLDQLAPAPPAAPDWLDQPDDDFAQEPQPALARMPLIPDAASRAILSVALATQRRGREVDVATLVRRICRRESVPDLPRQLEATLERGCQLLLDYSASMVPWWEDLASLKAQVRWVVGEETTQTYSFDRDPTAAGRWTASMERETWCPDGRPVLVATDLGIQGREGYAQPPTGWEEAVDLCARHGSPLVLFIPWPKHRWPRNFGIGASALTLVPWSPQTSAAMVRHGIARRG